MSEPTSINSERKVIAYFCVIGTCLTSYRVGFFKRMAIVLYSIFYNLFLIHCSSNFKNE